MKRVFIYGSCTSRDAVHFYGDYGLELCQYVARQSLISAFRPSDISDFVIPEDQPSFQKRMFDWDIRGLLPRKLREAASKTDVVIWDLTDERLGVWKVASGGMVTRNNNVATRNSSILDGHYAFGTEAHMRQWRWALGRFVALLDDLELRKKIILNATPWALRDVQGRPFVSESSIDPVWFNQAMEQYLELVEQHGISVARVPVEHVRSDPNHKWGPAYFHYAQETYQAQLREIVKLLD